MSIQKLGTKFSTGAWLPSMKEFFKKINEIIDNLNGTGPSNSGSYKVYVANLTQSSTDAPTKVILENTLGNVVFTYDSAGYYIGTLTGAFATASKCMFCISKQFICTDTGGLVINKEIAMDRIDADTFYVWTEQNGSLANGILNNTTIEIRVYN